MGESKIAHWGRKVWFCGRGRAGAGEKDAGRGRKLGGISWRQEKGAQRSSWQFQGAVGRGRRDELHFGKIF